MVTLEGIEHTFTDAHLDPPRGYNFRDGELPGRYFYDWSGDIAGLPTEDEDPFTVFSAAYRISGDEWLRGYVVVGNPTAGFGGVTGASATYSDGVAVLDTYLTEGYRGPETGRIRYRGTATLTANFTARTVSGRLHGFDNGAETVVMTIPETPFDARGFSGQFELSGTNDGGDSYSAVVGTISGTGVSGDTRHNGIGWFGAERD